MSESGSIKMTASAPSPTAPSSVTAVTPPPASDGPIAVEVPPGLGRGVEPAHVVPGRDEPPGHRDAHVPEPDEADDFARRHPARVRRHDALPSVRVSPSTEPAVCSSWPAECKRTPPARSPIASTTRLLISSP